ncbi:MAG: glycosyltransferase family 1 protein [Ruminococcaceae bacterium]|nr:glycosyltransferase family 1 protein [Oscillospiraceae bacterium]
MKPKVIQVIPSFRTGGAEALVKNYLLAFDNENCNHEALVVGERCNYPFEQVLLEAGVKITFLSELYKKNNLPGKLGHIVNALRWRSAVRNYFKKAKPDVVHCHLNVAQMIVPAVREFKTAKLFYTVHSDPDKYWGGGKNLKEVKAVQKILSHNNIMFFALHSESVLKIKKYFGENVKVEVLHNAVDTAAFSPTAEKRAAYRKELNVADDTMVVGHVGRFFEPKNHEFIIDVFSALNKKCNKSHLVLVGDGELRKKMEEKVKSLSLEDCVSFLGNRLDISNLLSAFDVFLFPSLWEGLPLTLIEAQAAELPCYVSDTVTRAIDRSNLMTYLPLDIGAEKWAENILSYEKKTIEYNGLLEYDIHTVIEYLMHVYGIVE